MSKRYSDEPRRIDIFGTKFSNINLEETIDLIKNYSFSKPNYICFPSTNTIAKAYKNKKYQDVLNNAFLTMPDGKVTELYARLKGFKKIRTTSGYWLMLALLNSNLSHYFYGVDKYTLNILERKIRIEFPNANIVGYKAPPMLNMYNIYPNKTVLREIQEINLLKPDIIWLGIGGEKNDFLMHHYVKYLDYGLMIGVGAVFLYMAGTIRKGPEWIKQLGLRWLFRLIQEPKRIWKSTIPSGIFFLYLVLKELISKKR